MNKPFSKHLVISFISLVILACSSNPETTIIERITQDGITMPNGFEIEKLYSPGAHDQGSWVSVTKDDEGRLYASDQYGNIYRVTLPDVAHEQDSVKVKKLNITIGMAQGLLWHNKSLYALVNADPNNQLKIQSGFYKITDTNKDDEFDTVSKLRSFDGFGEHGPHNIVLSPDEGIAVSGFGESYRYSGRP